MGRALEIRASFMRGGTSKGVFFHTVDLPAAAQRSTRVRDQMLLRIVGSPDPYGKQIDGMGGASSSTSKVALIARTQRHGCDVSYLFGAVSIDAPLIDWSGNCGNLSAAVGPFAIAEGLVSAPRDGIATVRIWQANIGRRIVAHVPMQDGQVVESGDFGLDGVPFPGAKVELEFLDPAGNAMAQEGPGSGLFPTGRRVDRLQVPGLPAVEATLLNAGNPTVFVTASDLGLRGTEAQAEVDGDAGLLARMEALRAQAAVQMGLCRSADEATRQRPATPKLLFFAPPADYTAAGGRRVRANEIDLVARIMSMGKLHHAMTGSGGVAIAVAACVPGTVLSRLLASGPAERVRFGHASGILEAGAVVSSTGPGTCKVEKVLMARSARRLMVGSVCVPADVLS